MPNFRTAKYMADGTAIDDPNDVQIITAAQSAAVIAAPLSQAGSTVAVLNAAKTALRDPAGGADIALGGSANFPGPAGEVGAVDTRYPVGDVRRYGVSPDGVVVQSVSLSGTTATAAIGTFTAGRVNMSICGRAFTNGSSKILSVSGDGSSATLQTAATASYSGPVIIGTQWEAAGAFANIYINMTLPDVCVYFPPGLYATGLNFTNSSSNSKMHFAPGAEIVSIFHLITDGVAINRNISITGVVTTYDRFGTIQLRDSYIEAIRIKDGSSLGLALPRGAHLYTSTQNIDIDVLTIDGCSTVNGDAALAIDDASCERIRIGSVIIQDSDVHGLILEGLNHEIGEVTINGYGRSTYLNAGVTGSTGLAQSLEMRGAWLHRSPGSKIGTLRVTQAADVSVSCVTANTGATITAAVAGALSTIRVGQKVAGSGISDHSLMLAVTTINNPSVTGAGFSALVKGQPISGTGVASGALVLSIASDASLTMTLPAIASGTVTLTAGCIVRTIDLNNNTATISNPASAAATASLTFSRPAALYSAIFTDSAVGSGPGMMHVDTLIAAGATRRGISIGDRNFISANCRVAIGVIDATVYGGNTTLDSGYSMLHVNAVTGGPSFLSSSLVRLYNTFGSQGVYVAPGGDANIGKLDCSLFTGNASFVVGNMLQVKGRCTIGSVVGVVTGVSSSAVPIVIGPSNDGPVTIGTIKLEAASTISTLAVDLSSAFDFSIGPIHTLRYNGFPAILVNGSARGVLRLGVMTDVSAAGWGLRFQNNTGVLIDGGKITGFAKGTTGSAANNTRCGARGLEVSGNTANTDLAAGQLTTDATCLNATL